MGWRLGPQSPVISGGPGSGDGFEGSFVCGGGVVVDVAGVDVAGVLNLSGSGAVRDQNLPLGESGQGGEPKRWARV